MAVSGWSQRKERSAEGGAQETEVGFWKDHPTQLMKSSQIKTETVLDRKIVDITSPVGEQAFGI